MTHISKRTWCLPHLQLVYLSVNARFHSSYCFGLVLAANRPVVRDRKIKNVLGYGAYDVYYFEGLTLLVYSLLMTRCSNNPANAACFHWKGSFLFEHHSRNQRLRSFASTSLNKCLLYHDKRCGRVEDNLIENKSDFQKLVLQLVKLAQNAKVLEGGSFF